MFKISSERLGKIGDFFDAAAAEKDGVNVLALIAGGFIAETSTKTDPKPAKTEPEPSED
jgi:hypothetical protein